MTPANQHNIGAFVAVQTGVLPQAATAAVNGASIDRAAHNMALSCVLHQVLGAATGAPTGVSVVTKLQHSPDNATWADYTPPGASSVAVTPALTAVSTENSLAIDLASANRYIRPVTTPTLTGGTSPTILVAADVVLGGEQLLPSG
jgi:hypothetical protein